MIAHISRLLVESRHDSRGARSGCVPPEAWRGVYTGITPAGRLVPCSAAAGGGGRMSAAVAAAAVAGEWSAADGCAT